MREKIRVLRIIEYVGTRLAVENQIRRSLHGTREFLRGDLRITTTTITEFPEVFLEEEVKE